mmetsp:Transcript_43643/g.113756  ORF Transcript_43643/g.113756 Transcript_43643/m.113756 type:complete len:97 (+) Transcript_43643:112-402(+)|eukprot:CAMPEP_0113887810 /NCGR_PEP_ID=MMETSP0780_2-20120614/12454_1 /TAXON_ID=652834 /ORGANISM="Palpitomonas bilix" /LENGTH=96 /DNA_ID=CAMNT_0000876451 /DNA_START=14 /DNA_END=304 /DNA_ORIENTATION=+ /assembly_acc=CAM_ASM_000599
MSGAEAESVIGAAVQEEERVIRLKLVRSGKCGLCQRKFRSSNLPGITSACAVLQKRADWGDSEAKSDPRIRSPTRLYESVPLCVFCSQFFQPQSAE